MKNQQTATTTAPATEKKPTYEELQAQLDALKAAQNQPQPLTIKKSEKGAVSIYGLQRMPVTLYASQWERLSAHMSKIMEFIEANRANLASKN